MQKHCFIYHMLTHEKEDCPLKNDKHRGASSMRIGISQQNTIDQMEDIRRKGWEKRPACHTSNELSSRERAYYPRGDDHTTSHRKDVQGDYRNARAGGSMSYYREVSRPSSGVEAQHRFNRDKPRLLDSISESNHRIIRYEPNPKTPSNQSFQREVSQQRSDNRGSLGGK